MDSWKPVQDPGRRLTQPMNEKTLERVRFRGKPLANPLNVVHSGRARFTILAPRLLRLEWSETGQWEDRATYAFPTRSGPPVPHQSRLEGDTLVLQKISRACFVQFRHGDRRRQYGEFADKSRSSAKRSGIY